MVKQEYDPDKDYMGHSKADYLIRKYGSIENVPKLIKSNPLENIVKKPLKEIMKFTPREIGIAPDADSKIIKYFKEFKNEGYNVDKPYMKMDSVGRWNYFLSFLRENDYFKQE